MTTSNPTARPPPAAAPHPPAPPPPPTSPPTRPSLSTSLSIPKVSAPSAPPPPRTPPQPTSPPTTTTTTTTTTTATTAHHTPPTKPATPPRHADPVLPRNARVRIVGNNRTKWDLIGRVGVVRASQTLGGWHEVQLTDGGIVRVQRNALHVLELPQPDPSTLVRIESARAHAAASGSRPLSPLFTDRSPNTHRIAKRPRPKQLARLRDAHALHSLSVPALHANMSKLNVASLRRYRSVYKLNVAKDCSKDELVGAVSRHFERTTVNETEVISNFLRHLARRGGPAASD